MTVLVSLHLQQPLGLVTHLLNYSYLCACEAVSHCDFYLCYSLIMCLLDIYIFPSVKSLFKSFAHLNIVICPFIIEFEKLFFAFLDAIHLSEIRYANIFYSMIVSSLAWWYPFMHNIFNIHEVQLINFFSCYLCFFLSYLRNHCLIQGRKNICLCFLKYLYIFR